MQCDSKEQWRCLDQSKSFEYIMDTHDLLVNNPDSHPMDSNECPVIDPMDSKWCSNGEGFYPVPCM